MQKAIAEQQSKRDRLPKYKKMVVVGLINLSDRLLKKWSIKH